jgi:hypothetical protein
MPIFLFDHPKFLPEIASGWQLPGLPPFLDGPPPLPLLPTGAPISAASISIATF